MDTSKHPLDNKVHPVIDSLEKTRSDHREEPFPRPSQTIRRHSTSSLDHMGSDVVDQILQQAEAIPLPLESRSASSTSHSMEGARPTSPLSGSWQSLASRSTNQLPSKTIVDSTNGSGSGAAHEYEHEKHSVLPEILPGFKDRMADIHHATYKSISDNNSDSSDNNIIKGRSRSASQGSNRRLPKSSILYESAGPTDPAAKVPEMVDQPPANPSKTLIQGGQGGRRCSSPSHHGLSPEEKLEAAKVAFGGSEESGDQTVYLEGLQDHLRHEKAERAAAEAASLATTATTTNSILGSAPDVAQEHHKSIFHLAANPETKKSMLLEHPESLGYHARDPNHAPFEESNQLAPQHRLAGDTAGLSKMTR
ncbi:hypothetical protein BGZ80_009154 [Entomortierella chlamydospora]|uniref:Uncharacterized protein n=1 Tax=Entomortierella chlamydospora TaxID=101097 RepID=A0A9P6MX97_9FUNG|nr:hypothetical protein BGZ80_009154 [Entomortierella chlamydospora]